jgi:ribosomal protein S18 acetylase RimI-like enzyme
MPASPDIDIRPFREADRAFLVRLMPRLVPARTASPREPGAIGRGLVQQALGDRKYPPGTEIFIALVGNEPAGLLAIRPDTDYFTAHPRAYVELLAVDQQSEGRGVGRALMAYAEHWARRHGCLEVVLDVFARNEGAIAFYRRLGYEPDHIRMAKPLAPGDVSREATIPGSDP